MRRGSSGHPATRCQPNARSGFRRAAVFGVARQLDERAAYVAAALLAAAREWMALSSCRDIATICAGEMTSWAGMA